MNKIKEELPSDRINQMAIAIFDIPTAEENANIDLKTSTLTPLHANWIINTHYNMSKRPELINSGFQKVGL